MSVANGGMKWIAVFGNSLMKRHPQRANQSGEEPNG